MPEKTTSITSKQIAEIVELAQRERWHRNAIEYIHRTPVDKQRWDEYRRICDGGDPPEYPPPGPSIAEIISGELSRMILELRVGEPEDGPGRPLGYDYNHAKDGDLARAGCRDDLEGDLDRAEMLGDVDTMKHLVDELKAAFVETFDELEALKKTKH